MQIELIEINLINEYENNVKIHTRANRTNYNVYSKIRKQRPDSNR